MGRDLCQFFSGLQLQVHGQSGGFFSLAFSTFWLEWLQISCFVGRTRVERKRCPRNLPKSCGNDGNLFRNKDTRTIWNQLWLANSGTLASNECSLLERNWKDSRVHEETKCLQKAVMLVELCEMRVLHCGQSSNFWEVSPSRSWAATPIR